MAVSRKGEANASSWCIRTYGDLNAVITALKTSKVFKAVKAIVHDKDVGSDGKLLEPHIHMVLQLRDRRLFSTVRNLVWQGNGMQGMFLEPCKDTLMAVRYLTHLDHPDKYQYSENDILTCGIFDDDEMNKYLYMLEDLQAGCSPKLMLKKYGKDFLRNFSALRDIMFYESDWQMKQAYLDSTIKDEATPFDEGQQLSIVDSGQF